MSEAPGARIEAVTLALYRERPHYSARRTFSTKQLFILYVAGTAALAALAAAPGPAAAVFVGLFIVFYVASLLFKMTLFIIGPAPRTDPLPSRMTDDALPLYTILVPLYRECDALPALLKALSALDYPPEKLDVKLLLEADDPQTAQALAAHALAPHFEIVTVPLFGPRTKPKALAYGVSYARGTFLVVYDAEDQPEPDQLRKALAAFAKAPHTACLQARLNVFNARENWLCRLYAIDYCLWFDYLLPGLEALGAPLPLGGSSNHFRIAALRAAGGWDPFNVTEDADLGIRLAREGWHVGMIASTTYEEAPPRLKPWLSQRARWMKGYLQTYLVHMRDRARLHRETGAVGVALLDLFLLGPVLAGLANPLLWLLFAIWLVTGAGVLGGLTGNALLAMSLLALVGGNGLILFLSLLAPLRRQWLDLVPYALGAPLYWLLISAAAWLGLFGLFLMPFHWAKTAHGLSGFEASASLCEKQGAPR